MMMNRPGPASTTTARRANNRAAASRSTSAMKRSRPSSWIPASGPSERSEQEVRWLSELMRDAGGAFDRMRDWKLQLLARTMRVCHLAKGDVKTRAELEKDLTPAGCSVEDEDIIVFVLSGTMVSKSRAMRACGLPSSTSLEELEKPSRTREELLTPGHVLGGTSILRLGSSLSKEGRLPAPRPSSSSSSSSVPPVTLFVQAQACVGAVSRQEWIGICSEEPLGSMSEKVSLLARSEWFGDRAPLKALREVAMSMEPCTYLPQSEIRRPGDVISGVVVILSGCCTVMSEEKVGPAAGLILSSYDFTVGPGYVFGAEDLQAGCRTHRRGLLADSVVTGFLIASPVVETFLMKYCNGNSVSSERGSRRSQDHSTIMSHGTWGDDATASTFLTAPSAAGGNLGSPPSTSGLGGVEAEASGSFAAGMSYLSRVTAVGSKLDALIKTQTARGNLTEIPEILRDGGGLHSPTVDSASAQPVVDTAWIKKSAKMTGATARLPLVSFPDPAVPKNEESAADSLAALHKLKIYKPNSPRAKTDPLLKKMDAALPRGAPFPEPRGGPGDGLWASSFAEDPRNSVRVQQYRSMGSLRTDPALIHAAQTVHAKKYADDARNMSFYKGQTSYAAHRAYKGPAVMYKMKRAHTRQTWRA